MKMLFRSPMLLAASAGFWCASAFFAAAQAAISCSSFSITNTAFGSVDVTANAAFDTTATLSLTCTSASNFQVCVNLGAGSGGATNAAKRFMQSGANKLGYGLFTDPARSTPWGSYNWPGGSAKGVIINFTGGTQTKTRTIYGRVLSGQQTVPAGSYLSSFSGTDAQIVTDPSNCTVGGTSQTTSFNVTATVPTTCSISANNLAFGTAGTLGANTDASTTLSPVCTNGTPYNIGLDGGLSGATDPTQRKMKKAAEFVLYGLYRDSARSLPFGNIIGTNTQTGAGTGLAQSVSVFGRIAPQATPSPGTYNDTIVVTLTY